MPRPRKRLLTFNDPTPLRIDRRLAMEIGFLESVVLLQLEYLIGISGHERDGQLWTYQTLQDLKDIHFPWLSIPTISRVIRSLEEMGLLTVGNPNRSTFDRTRWFALRFEGIRQLKSVHVGDDAPAIFQNEKWSSQTEKTISQTEKSISHHAKSILQPDKSILQDVTTIPEISTENSTENTAKSTTTRPPRSAASSGAAATEGEGVVVASLDQNSVPETPAVSTSRAKEMVEALCSRGVTRRNAEKLAADFPAEAIERQIAMLDYRKADEPAAVLVTAIEQAWAPPETYLAAAKQRIKAERRARQEQLQAETASVLEAAEADRRARLERIWEGLPQADRDGIDAHMRSLFRERHPALVEFLDRNPSNPIVRSMLAGIREELLAERAGE